MKKNNNVLPLLMPAIVLTIISVVIAGVLGVTNKLTAPAIAENTLKSTNDALSIVVPSASEFKKVAVTTDENEIYVGYSVSGEEAGYAVAVSPMGFGGSIDIIVGFSVDKLVTGVEIINSSETAGLGSKASDKAFKEQFFGKTPPLSVIKNGVTENSNIVAISGATITSRAVTSGVNTALTELNNYLGGVINE